MADRRDGLVEAAAALRSEVAALRGDLEELAVQGARRWRAAVAVVVLLTMVLAGLVWGWQANRALSQRISAEAAIAEQRSCLAVESSLEVLRQIIVVATTIPPPTTDLTPQQQAAQDAREGSAARFRERMVSLISDAPHGCPRPEETQ